MDVIKVRTDANPAKVAGAIAKAIRKLDYNPVGQVEVRAVGERATYLASRAIEKARGFLADEAPDGYELSTSIVSECVELSGKDNLTIVFQLGWQQKRNEVA
jgi:stage V sporulation protein SpoVS